MFDDFEKLRSVKNVAGELGVIPRRVLALIRADCPDCNGEGCATCGETGRRLPAQKARELAKAAGVAQPFIDAMRDTWLIPEAALALPRIASRKVGSPENGKGNK